MNIGMHISFWVMFFSGCMPSSGIARLYGSSSWQIKVEKVAGVTDFLFLGSGLLNVKITQLLMQPWNWKTIASWLESYDKPWKCAKKQRPHFADKGPCSQGYGLSSSHVQMWELDHKEDWVLKNWCFWAVMLEKTLESPLDCKIKPVNLRGNQPWILFGRTDAEAPILWPLDAKIIGKDPDVWKDWKQKREEGDRGWDGWMASPIQWTWVWAKSGRWWGSGSPGKLRAMGVMKSQTQAGDGTTAAVLPSGLILFVYSLGELGLCCCIWALSSCGEWELLSGWDVQAPRARSFSCFGAQAVGAQAQCTGWVALWWVEASQTRDLNHWTTREVPACIYMFKILYNKKCKNM